MRRPLLLVALDLAVLSLSVASAQSPSLEARAPEPTPNDAGHGAALRKDQALFRSVEAVAHLDGAARPDKLFFSLDGGSLGTLTFGPWFLRTPSSTTIDVWRLADKKLARRVTYNDMLTSAAFSPDGKQVVGGVGHSSGTQTSLSGGAVVWNVATAKSYEVILRTRFAANVTDAQLSPSGRAIAIATLEGTVYLVNAADDDRILAEGGFDGVPSPDGIRLFFSPTGDELTALGEDVRVWDASTLKPKDTTRDDAIDLRAGTLSSEGWYGASVPSGGRSLSVFDLRRRKKFASYPMDDILWDNPSARSRRRISEFAALGLSHDGVMLATKEGAEGEERVVLWQLDGSVRQIAAPEELRLPIAFSPDGKSFASWTKAGRIGIFRIVGVSADMQSPSKPIFEGKRR